MATALSSLNNIQPHQPQSKSAQLASHISNNTNVAMQLSRRYEQLLTSEKYWDCIFHIEGIEIKCHKLILSAASPVFEAMFFGPIREENQEIEILDISAKIFDVLVRYIYTGLVDFNGLSLEKTIELYYCAEKYLLNEFIDECLLAITRKLRFSNILPALELSVCMDLRGLLDVCMAFFTRCCLGDPQYMEYFKSNYIHISKNCVKTIIAASKDLLHKHLLWFVYEWCQEECKEMGLQKGDCGLIINDLQLQENGMSCDNLLNANLQFQPHCSSIERSYYKACRPFIVGYDTYEWKLSLRCNRFVSLLGIMMHSRLTPNVVMTMPAALSHSLGYTSEYNESLRLEISTQNVAKVARARPQSMPTHQSDSEGESDHEQQMEQGNDHDRDVGSRIIWQHTFNKQITKFNCDLNIRWLEGVTLAPDVDYQLKLIWPRSAYGAEYPCSLQSNLVDGIQFIDSAANYGSLIKGLHFVNLI